MGAPTASATAMGGLPPTTNEFLSNDGIGLSLPHLAHRNKWHKYLIDLSYTPFGLPFLYSLASLKNSSPMTPPLLSPPPAGTLVTLAVMGPDARRFLQGQCTQDVLTLPAGASTRAAILTPQGRIFALAWVRGVEEGLRLLLPADLADRLRAHLLRYLLRSKVELSLTPTLETDLEGPHAVRLASNCADWSLAGIRAGEPEVSAATASEWIPQMLNLDLLGAISFQKGCYTGQEIVARTQHLGRIKRRLCRYRLDGPAPEALDTLLADGVKVGEVVVAAADGPAAECLAVVGLESRHRTLTLLDGRLCTPEALPYAVP